MSRIVKVALMARIRASLARLNCWIAWHHVASALNVADAASRDPRNVELRTCPRIFAEIVDWAAGRFTIDWMGSSACRVGSEGMLLPFVSRVPDGAACGVNFFAHDVRWQPSSRGESAFGWLNPPFGLRGAVVRHVIECGGAGVIVVPLVRQPWPLWRSQLGMVSVRRLDLGGYYAQRRRAAGWVTVESVHAEAIEYRIPPSLTRVERSNEW